LNSGAGAVVLDVSLANEESITINSLGGTTGANLIDDLTNTAATSLTLTGARALTIDSMTSQVVTSIDASDMTGAFIMNTANAGAVASTITGGTGADTLLGGSAADSISGGAGNDSITGAAGNDVITGDAGNDTIIGGGGIDNLSGGEGNDTFSETSVAGFISLAAAETVSGGEGNDTLSLEENTGITVAATDLLGISSVETISIDGTANAGAVTLTDAVYTANGATTLSIVDGDLTQGILTVNASALTAANSVVVTGNTATTVNDSLVGGAGADTFNFSTVAGLEATDTVTGGAGIDTIILNGTTAAVTGVLTATTLVENVTTTGTAGDVIITVGADAVIAAAGTLTTNASSVTNGAFDLAYDGSAVTTVTKIQNVTGTTGADTITGGSGNDIIVGGDGADVITGGVGTDNLSGGAGNDTFVVATTGAGFTGLTIAETVSGGAGNDTLQFAAGTVAIAASDLVNMSGIENIEIQNTTQTASLTLTDATFTTNGATTLAVNSVTATSGVLTLAASTLSAANSVQLNLAGAANTAVHNVVLGAGSDTVTIDMDALNNTAITIQGGAGTDTMVFTENTANATVAVSAAVTGFENVSFITGLGGAFAATVNDANVAAGVTQTINGSNITGTLLWNGAAELDGKFSITGGTGIDTLTGGSLADTISGGAGADVITGGLGADALTGGGGADTFAYALTTQSNATNTDSITDFVSGVDKLQVTLDYSALTTALDINAVRSSAGVAGTTLAQDSLSGQRGQYVYDTDSSSLFVNFNADNLLTTSDYKIGINAASTATASVVEGDINFVVTGGTNADTITTGGGADTIDGGTGADLITGGAGADSITAGTGADTIVGGSGADTIVLGAAGDADVIRYSQAAGADGGATAAAADTITGMVAGEDTIAITGALKTAIDLSTAGTITDAKTSTGAAGNVATAATTELLFSVTANSALATADFGTLTAVATALNAMFDFTTGPNGPVLALIAGGAATAHGLYLYTETGTTGDDSVSAAELVLLGVITSDAALAATAVTIA
jgi:Ca2+-binding RTX toxin-like protein